MNRLDFLIMAVAATFMLTAAAFKKDNQTVQTDSHKAPLAFVGKNLVLSSFQVNPAIDLDADGKLDNDLTVFLRDCEKDNTITFEKSGVLSDSNGQLSCSANATDTFITKPGHWTYDELTKTIRIVKGSEATHVSDWKVLDASGSGLTLERSVTEPTRSYKTVMILKAVQSFPN